MSELLDTEPTITTAQWLSRLSDEFPREQISWRAQSLTSEGDKAMALAFIDARDVMDRLDAVIGPENWSDTYDVHANVTICTIAIRTQEGWVSKSDGAGDTDVEAEKGRISDAFKRAAVRWGIGRYLYAMPAPWVPCLSYERNGKKVFKKWTENPWDHVALTAKPPQATAGGAEAELATSAAQPHWTVIAEALTVCTTTKQLLGVWQRHEAVYSLFPDHFQAALKDHYLALHDKLKAPGVAAKSETNRTAGSEYVAPNFEGGEFTAEQIHASKIATTI